MRGTTLILSILIFAAPGLAARSIGHPPTRDKGPVAIQNPVAAHSGLHAFTRDHGPWARPRAVVPDPRQGQGRVDHPATRDKGPWA